MRIKRLNWDKRNVIHIACHGITVEDEEEADFWDSFDTAQIMEEGEEIELEYKPETAIWRKRDICSHRMPAILRVP